MPTNSRVFLKPFIGGLNTEGSDTDDMVLNTSDELNCTILPEQMRGRRYGFNIEKDGQWIDSGEDIVAHSLYHWNNVYENVNYIVVQINKSLYIYPDIKPHSQQTYLKRIDLSEFETLTVIEPVSMTSVSSSLFVVGRWIKPIVIEAIANTTDFTVVVNNPKFRDFNGVEDGYAIDYLPTNMTSRHLYNLINQGWDKNIFNPTDGTTKNLLPNGPDGVLTDNGLFYTDYAAKYGTGCYPANNMQWFLGKQNSGEYNTTDVLNTYFGNTPAPKGHFIIDYLNRDRSAVSGIELDDEPAQTGTNYDATIPVNNSDGMTKWELACRLHFGFDHPETYMSIPNNYKISYNFPINVSGTLTKFSWGLKDFCQKIDIGNAVSPNPDTVVDNALRSNSAISDLYIFCQPFTMSLIGVTSSGTEVVVATQVIQLTGKMFTADGWDFTVANTTSYKRYEIRITWPNLDRSHKWLVPDSVTETLVINEINYDDQSEESYEGLPSSDLLRGAITDIESFGGRLFYLCGNTILFSQTLSTNNKNYDKCYQDADPTSEEVSDIIATDGGMIQLLSLGRGKALKRFYRGVLVFGDEEVTGILSNSINLFTAESYDVVKITSAGLTSKYSVVETDSNVFYWSNHGIFMVGIDENNNISSVCISLNSIQNWYNNLPQFARDNCVGYYDYANNRIYWFYPTTNMADKLDGCLVYDLTSNCFMPQYIDSGYVIRDLNGRFAGILSNYKNTYTSNGKTYNCSYADGIVYDSAGEILGYTQDKYLTDCQESSSVYEIEPTIYLRAGGAKVVAGQYKVLASSTKDAGYNRKSAGVFLVSDGTNYSFGDFNDREFRDWDVSPYESYLVSRPITLGDTYWNKQTPVMQTLFKRTEGYPLTYIEHEDAVYNVSSNFAASCIRSPGEYPVDPRYGVLTKPNYAQTFIPNNDGFFKSCSFRINVSDFLNSDIYLLTAYVKSGVNLLGYTSKHSFTITTPYIDMDVFVASDKTDLNNVDGYEIGIQLIDSNKSYISGTLHPSFTATFIQQRSNYYQPMFKRLKEVVIENESETTFGVPSTIVNIPVFTVPEGYLKEAEVTWLPEYTDQTDDVTWNAVTVLTNNASRTYMSGNPGPSFPIESASIANQDNPTVTSWYDTFPQGYTETIFKLQGTGWRFYHATLTDLRVRYKLTMMVPEYEENPEPTKTNGYTTPSGAYIRMRWGWSLNPLSNRWDMVQNGYRPQKDFLHDDYVESRLHIRGRGKAFQIEIRNDDNKDFRLTGLNIITRSPQ